MAMDDPMALLVRMEDPEKQSASTAQSEALCEVVCLSLVTVCIDHSLIGSAVLTTIQCTTVFTMTAEQWLSSKMSFNPKDSFVGGIDTALSITPPLTVSSLTSVIVKAEGIIIQKVQLFKDIEGEVTMSDTDQIPIHSPAYLGHEPITIVYSQEEKGTCRETQCQIQALMRNCPERTRS